MVFFIMVAIFSADFGIAFQGYIFVLIPAATQAIYLILDESSSPVIG